MGLIDAGSPAVDRAVSGGASTRVVKNNPANASGDIMSVEMWSHSNLSDVEVATFYVVSGNNLSTRDSHAIGSVTSGSKQTFSGLDVTVEANDYIGMYWSGGEIDADTTGYVGYWWASGDKIPCSNQAFTFYSGRTISLYGTGETPIVGVINAIVFGCNV